MLPELSRLIDLQDLDREMRELSQALERLPEEVQNLVVELDQFKAEQETLSRELEDLKQQRRDSELEMAEMEDGIKKSRQRLMEIKSNIEYKAMLKEIAFKEDQRDQHETRILQFLERIETQQQLLADLGRRLEEQQQQHDRRRAEIDSQVAELQRRIAEFETKRQKFLKNLPRELLQRYEFIRQRRNGTAIAEVQEGVCQGCHMNILPQQFIDLQKGEEIIQCPHCQRILYWLGEAEDAESGGNGR